MEMSDSHNGGDASDQSQAATATDEGTTELNVPYWMENSSK